MQTELTKVPLRQQLLQQRQALSPSDWQQKSQQICQQIQRSSQFHSAQTVLAFFSVRQEPDLSLLWQDNASNPKPRRFGFPRCQDRHLVWHPWQPGQALDQGRFGITEPPQDAPQLLPHEVDLILVPCLALDRQGYRLGYGGGFYDRLFSQPEWRAIPTLGICFDFGYFDRLPRDAWDQPLQGICTESLCTESQQMAQSPILETGSN